jgi:Spy/CpxP family protein refolding chaperone
MRSKWIAAGVVATVLVGGGALVVKAVEPATRPAMQRLADRPLGRLLMGRMGRAMELKSELNLTDEQKHAIQQTLAAHKAELAKAMQPVVEKKRALRDAVLEDKGDEKAIRTAADELGKAIGDASVLLAKVKSEVRSNAKLTDEQMKQIKDFRVSNDAAIDKFLKEAGGQ